MLIVLVSTSFVEDCRLLEENLSWTLEMQWTKRINFSFFGSRQEEYW